jgi:transporter family protein
MAMSWWTYALLSAFFAALTAVLAKVGVESVPSNLATALRTVVIIVFVWAVVLARGEHHALGGISRKSLLFLGLSGLATGASWLAYFKALQLGPASRVAPLDKTSLLLTVLLAVIFLREPLTFKLAAGVALMVAGAALTLP